jgi:hypothetical protein
MHEGLQYQKSPKKSNSASGAPWTTFPYKAKGFDTGFGLG